MTSMVIRDTAPTNRISKTQLVELSAPFANFTTSAKHAITMNTRKVKYFILNLLWEPIGPQSMLPFRILRWLQRLVLLPCFLGIRRDYVLSNINSNPAITAMSCVRCLAMVYTATRLNKLQTSQVAR